MSAAACILTSIRQNPMVFNSLTGGVLCASSDAMAQQLGHRNGDGENNDNNKDNDTYLASSPQTIIPIDWIRTGSAGIIGMFFGGFVYPKAYAQLDAIWSGTKFSTVVTKSIVEIATVGIFVNSISMTSRGFCRKERTPPNEVFEHVVDELPTVTRNDFFVWMPYNLIAFSFVPAFIRPTTTAFMEASWQTYISLRSHDYGENEVDQKETAASVAAIATSASSSSSGTNQKANKISY